MRYWFESPCATPMTCSTDHTLPESAETPFASSGSIGKNGRDAHSASPHVWRFVTGLSSSNSERQLNKSIVRAHISRRQWAENQAKLTRGSRSSASRHGSQLVSDRLASGTCTRRERDRPSSSMEKQFRHDLSTMPTIMPSASTAFDPFQTYPSDLSRSFIDRMMPKILIYTSQLLPSLKQGPGTERCGIFTVTWMQLSIHDRAMFHTALFAALFNSRMLITNAPQSREELLCYHIAVREINHTLNGLQLTITDEVIQSVCCLAFHEDDLYRTLCKSPRQGPFRNLQLLDLYGATVSLTGLHIRGVMMMVAAKGGMDKLSSVVLPQLLS